jgi:hypothetical protein
MVGRVRQRSAGFARSVMGLAVLALINFGLWALVYFMLRRVLG